MEAALRTSELLKDLDGDPTAELMKIARPLSLATGEYLFLLGQSADRLYVLLSGQLDICLPLSFSGTMKDVSVEPVRAGATLGWSAFAKPYRFTLSARAAEPCEIAAFLRKDLKELFAREPVLGCNLMERIAEVVGRRLLTMQALWARELQQVVSQMTPKGSTQASG